MNRLLACLAMLRMRTGSVSLVAGLGLFFCSSWGLAEIDYEGQIKPILDAKCVRCHNQQKRESGLRLDRGAAILQGGDSGPIVVPGNSSKSRLIGIVAGNDGEISRMPPEGEPLSDAEIARIVQWIDGGAVLPQSQLTITEQSNHWAFRGPSFDPGKFGEKLAAQIATLGDVKEARTAIDVFLIEGLQEHGLKPSEPADRTTLIRRLSLDLRGVVPSVDEVNQFLSDQDPHAYGKIVDRFLNSPAYGERWGRHWLDLARYADSNGFTRDFERQMWKYRQWVVEAINQNMPFDQFTVEQIAGDLLPNPTLDQLIATGFHRNTLTNDEGGTDPEQFRVDAIADRVDTTGAVFLGLTIGCARCHHHKYDPISQRDYYQLFAFLNNCDEPQVDAPSASDIAQGVVERKAEVQAAIARLEMRLAEMQDQFIAKQLAWEMSITPKFFRSLNGPLQTALETKPEKRDATQKKLVAELFQASDVAREAFPIVKEIADLQAAAPTVPTAMILRERTETRVTRIHRRGNFLDEGEIVAPGVPTILPGLDDSLTQPTRLELARWLVSDLNPLTSRVVVNRFWQKFFGRGIVETENDFGSQGSPPTHPELLDWLAIQFVRCGWDVKALHRLIVMSAAYQQASKVRGDDEHVKRALEKDPYNRLFGRQTRIRLDAEVVRDSSLSASGLLTHKIGGPSVHPPQPDGVYQFTQDSKPWKTDEGEDRFRRAMYTFHWRSSPYPALTVFDAADANNTCTRRVRSNTPLQALTLANDIQFIECARNLALLAMDDSSQSVEFRIDAMFRRCLVRRPTSAEMARLMELWHSQKLAFAKEPALASAFVGPIGTIGTLEEVAAWTALGRVLINLDEFITRE